MSANEIRIAVPAGPPLTDEDASAVGQSWIDDLINGRVQSFDEIAVAWGTALVVLLCLTLTLAAGRDPPSLETEIIRGLFTLVQTGFGAVVGLLGGKRLHGSDAKLGLFLPDVGARFIGTRFEERRRSKVPGTLTIHKPQLPRSGPNGQPIESSHLENFHDWWNRLGFQSC